MNGMADALACVRFAVQQGLVSRQMLTLEYEHGLRDYREIESGRKDKSSLLPLRSVKEEEKRARKIGKKPEELATVT